MCFLASRCPLRSASAHCPTCERKSCPRTLKYRRFDVRRLENWSGNPKLQFHVRQVWGILNKTRSNLQFDIGKLSRVSRREQFGRTCQIAVMTSKERKLKIPRAAMTSKERKLKM